MAEQQKRNVSKETLDLIADLNADFGTKKGRIAEPAHKALNSAWHAKNPPSPTVSGKSPERLNPEESEHWRPVARVTHVVIQECASCSDTTEYIGGEYVKFRAITAYGGEILRRSENCSTLFLMNRIDRPLEDLIEWHYQKVSQCSGCIRVNQQAQAILWEESVKKSYRELQPKLPGIIDPDKPSPAFKPIHPDDQELDINL